jgi:hypothetical protein
MNPTSMSWDLGGVMSEIQLQRGKPSHTILHFSNFEPCDLCFIPSIMNLLYSLCNELWTYLKLELQCWIYTINMLLNYVYILNTIFVLRKLLTLYELSLQWVDVFMYVMY